jgi:energy-coupling factor transporter ATP-binding protein EcfA2
MYELHSLGWHSFQQLCLTITREILGQTVESFLDSSDAGKDGAFAGTWQRKQGEALHGRFVIQCKFTGKPGKNLNPNDLTDEVGKVRRLVENSRCDSYILMTNAGLSGSTAENVETLFTDIGVKHVALFGSTWICDQIKENKRLRMMVPRLYGLGDLSQILDERAYAQAKALLTSLSEDLSKVVLTGAYRKAAEALDQHGFVLLIGEPAAGKTTIASMLSMAALDQWGASTLKLDDAEKVTERWNPDEPSQFFWIDDAFGVTQYESFLANGWNHALPMVNTMLRKGAKIVMTSRDYIYKRARNDLKEGAFPLLRESQVVIDVHDLTSEEKQQILYNHIKLGKQAKNFRTAIKPHLPFIAAHSRFVPETARRLGDPIFTPQLSLNRYDLNDFVDKQEQLLQEVIRGLDENSKAALALIYMRNNSLESPVALEESEREALDRLGSNLGGCIAALESLNGSLAQYSAVDGTDAWRFKHPTVGDAYAGLLLQSHEWLGIYVHGSPLDKLTAQITCGDVGLERAVILPRGLFQLVLKRLDESTTSSRYKTPFLARWYSRGRIDDFLASRCSKEFLLQYIEAHTDIFDRVSKPGLFLNSVSEVGLAIRLHELGLLPEKYRREFVTTVIDYAIEGEDFYALESLRIQSVFTSAELSAFRERVRLELVPNLSDIRHTWESNRSSDQPPDEHMQPLIGSFSALKQEFADEPDILVKIDQEIQSIRQWVAEKEENEPKTDRPARTFGDVETLDLLPVQARGVFDDVDQ